MKKDNVIMHSDPTVTPPPVGTPDAMPEEHPYVRFSRSRWFFTGIVRLLYRRWTRIATFLFPEDSKTERLALALHIPLPDRLNMSWITSHLAVGGRIRLEDIQAMAKVGVYHVVDTDSSYVHDFLAFSKTHIGLCHLAT